MEIEHETPGETKNYAVAYQGRRYWAYLFPDGLVDRVVQATRTGLRTLYRDGGRPPGPITAAVISRARGHQRLQGSKEAARLRCDTTTQLRNFRS